MAKKRQKKRTHVRPVEDTSAPRVPKSIVIRTGKTTLDPLSSSLALLVRDVRKVMEPNTASRLKERHANTLKDYITMAGPLGVTHLLLFSRTELGANLRISRTPRGPTLHFRILEYSLAKDIRKQQKSPRSPGSEYLTSPLLVLNGFTAPPNMRPPAELQLLTATFQNLFPSLSAQQTSIASLKRVLLCNRTTTTIISSTDGPSQVEVIDLRHYAINTQLTGISKAVAKSSLAVGAGGRKGIPDLGNIQDVADYVLGEGGYNSASEIEEDAKVEIRQDGQRSKRAAVQQRAIKLIEIGPRLRLELVKIEEGIGDGRVLYHRYVSKTKEEEQGLEEKHRIRGEIKAKRRKEQEENVERRKKQKESQREEGRLKGVDKTLEPADDVESEMDEEEAVLVLEKDI